MADIYRPGWEVVERECRRIADEREQYAKRGELADVFGVPRGGCVPAAIVATILELPLVESPGPRSLVVDDLVDSGATARRYAPTLTRGWQFAALFRKPWSPLCDPGAVTVDAWIELPWEVNEAPALDAVLRLLQVGGLDTSLDHVQEAARRRVPAVADAAVSLVAAAAEEAAGR